MSFVTWKAGYIATNDREPSPFDSFYGGQAESQAQIAALQSNLTKAIRLAADYGIERDALQSEVAILKESNKGYQRTAQTILEIKSERDTLRNAIKAALICERFDFQKFEALVFTPASGEPARKP